MLCLRLLINALKLTRAQPLGVFEQTHQKSINTAIFADPDTLVTASDDCTVSVWTVVSTERGVDLQPRPRSLFGHQTPVTILAASRVFVTLLSASVDNNVILWDLNRLEKICAIQVDIESPVLVSWE